VARGEASVSLRAPGRVTGAGCRSSAGRTDPDPEIDVGHETLADQVNEAMYRQWRALV